MHISLAKYNFARQGAFPQPPGPRERFAKQALGLLASLAVEPPPPC